MLFFHLFIYYYANVVPAVVSEIQDENGLVYTGEITKNKEGKMVNKKHQNLQSVKTGQ